MSSDEEKKDKPPAAPSRSKQVDASREEFLTAALAVFARKGFHNSSVDEIVAKAGRSKGGFYHHFQSKDQLYLELVDQMLEASTAKLVQGMQAGDSVRNILMSLVASFEPVMTNAERMRAMTDFQFQALRSPEIAAIMKHIHKKLLGALAGLFRSAVERGELRGEFDAETVADLMLSSGRGIVINSLISDEATRIPERLHAFIRIQMRALETGRS
jgi:AcrR family transcriptional regulator